ncbi:hypothetical protein ACFO0N_03000 [Halobium salinum]|uniref:Uncharacterized protein n=1 Tax=Halobium salinum TaxID=1364940 RepID=A0ABD5P7S2_9EURY|nr:hypothetical protein [Halobium salinum]
MARLRSRSHSRSRADSRGTSSLSSVRAALPSLPSVFARRSGTSGFTGDYRTGLRLSQDLLNLALIVIGVRFALTGAFITVVSSHVLVVLAFNLLVTAPAMYRMLRRLGWVDGPAIGPGLAVAGAVGALGLVSGTLTPSRSSARSSGPSRRARLLSRIRGLSAPLLRSVRAALPSRRGSTSDRL